MTQHRFGWKPSLPDIRDIKYSASIEDIKSLPASVDLSTSPFMPPIADQGDLGSCTSFATCAAFDYLEAQAGNPFLGPSHLFQYYNTRYLEGTTGSDAGGTIRDAIKVTSKFGMCPETMWPYDISKYTTHPSNDCYLQGAQHEVVQYLAVNSTSANDIMVCLAGGFPVVFGATLYSSFEKPDANGVVPMPQPDEDILGGHAQVIVGYDVSKRLFKIRNSWGMDWAANGYEFMPYNYITNPNLADDFWTLRKLQDAPKVSLEANWKKWVQCMLTD